MWLTYCSSTLECVQTQMNIVGFFADGNDYQLPHPTIDNAVLLVTHNAICRAFELLRETCFVLGAAQEDDITRELQLILENHLRQNGEIPGFDERVFGKVWRAPEFTNFDGNHPAKKPDLVFELVRDESLVLSTHDALFVECKLVSNVHPVTTSYCNKGVYRFVKGDYGWAMQEGMMLAYVRHNYTLLTNLNPILTQEPYHHRLGHPLPLEVVPEGDTHPFAEELHLTTHSRDFEWPHEKGPANEIRIFHSWHKC